MGCGSPKPEHHVSLYRHRQHAGNPADVWKHEVLLDVVQSKLDTMPKGKPFRYCETHAGPGIYRPRSGLYHRGRQSPYEGSWVQVLNRLKGLNRPSKLFLVDRYVVPDRRYLSYRARNQVVRHVKSDGYDASLIRAFKPDLIFIDPPFFPEPDRDWGQIRQLCREMASDRVPTLIWYPDVDDSVFKAEEICLSHHACYRIEAVLNRRKTGLQRCGMILLDG